MKNKGTLIAVSWPQTPVLKEGKWYDGIMKTLGFLKNDFYEAGHASLVMVNHKEKEFLYLDFGRYHTPKKHGRVRDKFTDPDLTIYTKAIIEGNKIMNLEALFEELAGLKATHGEGGLIASEMYTKRYDRVFKKAKKIQKREAVKYGPFNIGGSNCSRFVTQSCRVSKFGPIKKFLVYFPYTVTPTPITNVKIINDYSYYHEYKNGKLIKKKNFLNFYKNEA